MKRVILTTMFIIFCLAWPGKALAGRYSVPRYLNKESSFDMSRAGHLYVEWVDLHEEDWGYHGYSTKQEWVDVIAALNASFNTSLVNTYLSGRTIVYAKSRDEVDPRDVDLIIRFSDVHVDYDHYHLILGIHFIDPGTGREVGSIPVRPYYGNNWGLRGYLNEALKEVGVKLRVEVSAPVEAQKKSPRMRN